MEARRSENIFASESKFPIAMKNYWKSFQAQDLADSVCVGISLAKVRKDAYILSS